MRVARFFRRLGLLPTEEALESPVFMLEALVLEGPIRLSPSASVDGVVA
jgi:hypothetical protein